MFLGSSWGSSRRSRGTRRLVVKVRNSEFRFWPEENLLFKKQRGKKHLMSLMTGSPWRESPAEGGETLNLWIILGRITKFNFYIHECVMLPHISLMSFNKVFLHRGFENLLLILFVFSLFLFWAIINNYKCKLLI